MEQNNQIFQGDNSTRIVDKANYVLIQREILFAITYINAEK